MRRQTKLITAPSVIAIASNYVNADAIRHWSEAHGLEDVAEDPETPLGALVEGAEGQNGVEPGDVLPEFAGRFCYRSMEKGRKHSDYVRNILEQGHGSVLEHSYITFAISGVSRSLTHELIRHRAGTAISQESQRYVRAEDMRFVVPPLLLQVWGMKGIEATEALDWLVDQEMTLASYQKWEQYLTEVYGEDDKVSLKMRKRILEAARASLPNAAETRLVWTANYRALRHIIELRGSEGADLEIRRLAGAILTEAEKIAPGFFADMDFAEETKGDLGVRRLEASFSKV